MPPPSIWARLRGFASFLVIMTLSAGLMNHLGNASRDDTRPAGLGRGMVDGALMPMTFPALLAGKDIPIYTVNNTGRGYKLGYIAGVNLCGAFFFGLMWYRWNRLRKKL